jgi:hypothetical protein
MISASRRTTSEVIFRKKQVAAPLSLCEHSFRRRHLGFFANALLVAAILVFICKRSSRRRHLGFFDTRFSPPSFFSIFAREQKAFKSSQGLPDFPWSKDTKHGKIYQMTTNCTKRHKLYQKTVNFS